MFLRDGNGLGARLSERPPVTFSRSTGISNGTWFGATRRRYRFHQNAVSCRPR